MIMLEQLDRRSFLKHASLLAAGAGLASITGTGCQGRSGSGPLFKISLAEWSLHRTLFANTITNLDFPVVAKRDFGIDAVEYVNQFWKDKARDQAYLSELNSRSDTEGVRNLLIMVDGEGALGDPDTAKRKQAIENHFKWVEAAKDLGCHSVRVNARSEGSYQEQLERAADGLHQLSTFAAPHRINVIVENHGGLSSNGAWLVATIQKVGLDNCGTLPDFGNFVVAQGEEYDRYKGVAEMMPYAKAVSAKSHDFDEFGEETRTNYRKMMEIVVSAGYHGYVGIEYEGSKLSEVDGIRATKLLMEVVRAEMGVFPGPSDSFPRNLRPRNA